MRTAGMLLADTPLPDGQFFITPIPDIGAQANVTFQLTGGIFPTAVVGAANVTIAYHIADRLVTRFGMQDDAQQQFGTAAITSGNQGAQALATPPAAFTTPYQAGGRPPFNPASSFFTNPTGRAKGIRPKAITLYYDVFVNPMTTFTVRLLQYAFSNQVTTDIIPVTSTGNLTVGAGKVVTIPVPPANQIFLTVPNSAIVLLLNVNNPAGGSINYYGATIAHDVNYN